MSLLQSIFASSVTLCFFVFLSVENWLLDLPKYQHTIPACFALVGEDALCKHLHRSHSTP